MVDTSKANASSLHPFVRIDFPSTENGFSSFSESTDGKRVNTLVGGNAITYPARASGGISSKYLHNYGDLGAQGQNPNNTQTVNFDWRSNEWLQLRNWVSPGGVLPDNTHYYSNNAIDGVVDIFDNINAGGYGIDIVYGGSGAIYIYTSGASNGVNLEVVLGHKNGHPNYNFSSVKLGSTTKYYPGDDGNQTDSSTAVAGWEVTNSEPDLIEDDLISIHFYKSRAADPGNDISVQTTVDIFVTRSGTATRIVNTTFDNIDPIDIVKYPNTNASLLLRSHTSKNIVSGSSDPNHQAANFSDDTTIKYFASFYLPKTNASGTSGLANWVHPSPPDTTSPVITISAGYGDANLYVYSGLSATATSTSNVAVTFAITPNGDGNLYSEAGATVTDNSGETLSVTVGGDTVDTTTDGTYVVTYTATDSAGNSRVRTKTVTVDDSVSLKHSLIVRKNNIRHAFNSVCRAYAAFDEQGSFRLKTHEDTVGFALFDNGRIAMDTDTAGEYTLNIATAAYMDIDFVTEGITNSSDERLKMNIESINDSSKLLDLQPVQYKWKRNPNGNLHYGFIAQDLQDIYPNLVEVNNSGRYSVNYIGIVPLMVDEIKRQTDEVNDLTKRLENLEDKKNDN